MRIYLLTVIFSLAGSSFAQQGEIHPNYKSINDAEVGFNVLANGQLWNSDTLQNPWAMGYLLKRLSGHPSVGFRFTFQYGGILLIGKGQDGLARMASHARIQQTYPDWAPGPINDPVDTTDCERYNIAWHVTRPQINQHIQLGNQYQVQQGGTIPVHLIPEGIRHWPAFGNMFTVDAFGNPLGMPFAPWVEVDGNPVYDPQKGDYPDVPGDECVYVKFNGASSPHHFSGGLPLEVEVDLYVYRFDALPGVSFYRWDITNRGPDLDSMVFGFLAQHTVTLTRAGTDTLRQSVLAFPTWSDSTHGRPFHSFTLLKGPESYAGGGRTALTRAFPFSYNPSRDSIIGLHNGLLMSASHSCTFPYHKPGEPGTGGVCDPCENPVWHHRLTASGPFQLSTGQSTRVEMALTTRFCQGLAFEGQCPSFSCIRSAVDETIAYYTDSVITSVPRSLTPLPEIVVYPNPATDQLTISLRGIPAGNVTVSLVDIFGRTTCSWSALTGSLEISLPQLPAGMYLVQVSGNGRPLITKPIIIQKP